MQIYPAIDIKNGQCVRLRQGSFEDVTVYGDDPIKMAEEWVKQGATYLHIVDLDGAKEGNGVNSAAIQIITARYNIPVQTGGGIRTMRDIENSLNLGVSRVILGTAAVKNPGLVKEAVRIYGNKVAVGIDAKNGQVAISGWKEVSQISALELCCQMADFGVETIIYTDIAKDGMMSGPNIEETKRIVEATGINIIGSGGISSMEDLENMEAIGVQGTILGKSLYQKTLQLSEVIQRFEKKDRF